MTTHLMEEAEKLCDRVAIVDHGKVVALGTPAALVRKLAPESRVVFTTNNPFNLQGLRAISSVSHVEQDGQKVIVYGRSIAISQPPLISEVVNLLSTQGVTFNDMRMEQPTLEDVFLLLTGRAMRD